MSRFNIIYLFIIIVFIGVLQINWTYTKNTAIFFGFAENKETEINHDHPVFVKKIHVTTGQSVNKGDLLAEVTHNNLDFKLNDVRFDIDILATRAKEKRLELNNKLLLIKTEKANDIAQIEAKIQEITAKVKLNQALVKDLESIKIDTETEAFSINDLRINKLKDELSTITTNADMQIASIEKELKLIGVPLDLQMKKRQNEQNFYETERNELSIFAPTDGLIGNIRCKEGENISSFSTLISFYERNPTSVKGFVHENLILHVSVGDSLEVTSSLHPEHKVMGKVTGLGTRIVEIPERLRKRPEFKTYGREVLIQIPSNNAFLQKEKVVLKLLNTDDLPTSRFIPWDL